LSMGYTTDIDWTAGVTPKGEAYDGVQRNIRANHLAFVPQARGGEKLRFGDGDDEPRDDHGRWSSGGGGEGEGGSKPLGPRSKVEILTGSHKGKRSVIVQTIENKKGGQSHMVQVNGGATTYASHQLKAVDDGDNTELTSTKDGDVLNSTTRKYKMPITAAFDGVTVEFADELSASNMNTAFSALKAKLKDAEKKAKDDEDDMDEKDKKNKADCDDAKAKIDAKDGEIAVLKKQLADAAVTPAMLDTMLRDREVVKDAARKVLDAKFPFDGKSVAEIKLAAVAAKLGDATVKDMNEAAVAGAFVALTAAAATAGTSRLADALGSHARSTVVVGDARSEGVRLRDEAHALMVDRMRFPKNYDADGRKIVA